MEIKNDPKINFKSILQPVKPFTLKTNKGKIYFKEVDYTKTLKKSLLKEISTFFLDNFASTSAHPFWKKCRKKTTTFDKEIYKDYIDNDIIKTIKTRLKNPDTTLMLGKNPNKKLVAAILANPLDLTTFVKNNNTLYIDLLAVTPKYRGNNVGKQLLTNVIESTKNRYTDVFLIAYNESVPFYQKLGFKYLENRTYNQQIITNSLARERLDYPLYASFLTKPLDHSAQRWYNELTFY